MVGIGLRVYSNSTIYYCIIKKEDDGTLNYIQLSRLEIPKSVEFSEALSFVRNTLTDVFLEYNVSRAIIRLPEYMNSVKKITIERFYVEGVLLEALASSNIERHLGGHIAELTRIGNIEKTQFKELAKGAVRFKFCPDDINWEKLKLEQRESILASYISLSL